MPARRLLQPFARTLTLTLVTAAACESEGGLSVVPNDPTSVDVVAGEAQIGLDGVPLRDSIVIVVRGDEGPVPGASVRWTPLSGGEVRPTTATTDAGGRAMTLWIPQAGADSIRATVGGAEAALSVTVHARGDEADPTTTYLGRNDYVEYRAGTLPIVLSAPHGGTLQPTEIPDRTSGTVVRDRNTKELAFAVADSLEALTGERPHLIVSHLHRIKLDPNREIIEAAARNRRAEQAWSEFQRLIEHAEARVIDDHGAGFYIDLHGHGHDIARLELGYLLNATELRQSDDELDQGTWAAQSSIRALVTDAAVPFSELLRGPDALGSLLEARGFAATPSDVQPDPGDNPFFSGGYNTGRHGSRDGSPVSGVQIEAPFSGVRESAATRGAFAGALARALQAYLARWY